VITSKAFVAYKMLTAGAQCYRAMEYVDLNSRSGGLAV